MSDIAIFSLHCITMILLIILSWTDIRSRIISNKIVFLLLLVIVPLAWIQYKQIFFLPALLTLVIGFLLFTFGVMGAGDIKLMSVLMLTIPHSQIIYFFLFTAFSGLFLIIIGFLFFRHSIRQHGLPYGVAISCGFLTNLFLFS